MGSGQQGCREASSVADVADSGLVPWYITGGDLLLAEDRAGWHRGVM